jgi:hypothetical protein
MYRVKLGWSWNKVGKTGLDYGRIYNYSRMSHGRLGYGLGWVDYDVW